MEELYINGLLIDLPKKSIAYTLQVNDLSDVKDRNAHYTNNIKIPKTDSNVEKLELLALAGNTTTLQYNSVEIKYVVDGIELISNGQGHLKNTNNFYNLVIYDGNIILTELLGKLQLNELDWSAHNHDLTEAQWTSSFTNTSGYLYVLGAYYELDSLANNSPFVIDVNTPSFYLHTLFNMIFNQQGHTVTGDIFSDSEYLSRVITMDRGFERVATNTQSLQFNKSTVLDPEIDESEAYTGPATTFNEYVKGSHTISVSSSHTVQVTGFVTITFGIEHTIAIKVNNVIREEFEFISDQTFNFESDLNLNAGDEVEIVVKIKAQEFSEFNRVQFSTAFNINIYRNTYSIPITFEDLIGDTLQIDFVKDIMQHFGLIFRKIKNDTVFDFIQIKELLIDRSGAEDWSDKYTAVINEAYKPPYAKNNILKYSYDDIGNSNIDQTYADGLITIDNNRLAEEKTLFTSLFKAGVLDNNFYRHKHWIDDDNVITINSDGLRIYKVLQVTDSLKYKFLFKSTGSSTLNGTVAKFQFIDYQEIVNSSYLEFQELIREYKLTGMGINLSVIDIYNIDFFKLKYIKQLGAYYYLNKVSNFKNERITRAELLRIGPDVVEGISAGSASYSGSSDYSATLTKGVSGDMSGSYSGTSAYIAILRKNDPKRFSIAVNSQLDSFSSCAESSLEDNWHDGAGSKPEVNDTVYTDSGGTTPKTGNNMHWKMETTHSLKIDNNGKVTQKTAC
jgi:hypothetical protein